MTTDNYDNRVRQNAGSCAVAAALMIYFGFFYGLMEPSGTDLFSRANWLFFHAIRAGGIAMTVLTGLSLTGQRIVLMIDAVVSIALGVVFALTGVAMLIDGGAPLQPALNVMFGWMFVSVGRRNWADYYALAERAEHTAGPMASPPYTQPPPPQTVDDRAATTTPAPLATEQIKPTTLAPLATEEIKPTSPAPPGRTTPEPETEPPRHDASDDTPNDAPAAVPGDSGTVRNDAPKDAPNGFLESFADEGPPPAP